MVIAKCQMGRGYRTEIRGQRTEGAGQRAEGRREGFTAEDGISKDGLSEANGFIRRREPLAYHPKMGR